MLLEGTKAEKITKLNPTIYIKHIWYNKQVKYVQLDRPYTAHFRQQFYFGNYNQRH